MPKKRKNPVVNKWLSNIKRKIVVGQSKKQPYHPTFMPWALDNRKNFYCDPKSHSFKILGIMGLQLLERAREAHKAGTGVYPEID